MTWPHLVLAVLSAAAPRPTPETVLGVGHGYRLERPAGWRLETFKGGYFMATVPFGGGMIVGHEAEAPKTAPLLKALAVRSVLGLVNVRDVRIVEQATGRIGGVEGVRVRYVGNAMDGKNRLAGIITVIALPTSDRVLSVLVRAVPPERMSEIEPVYEALLAAVTFVKEEKSAP